jgi:outer membrane protein assembly factor BamB
VVDPSWQGVTLQRSGLREGFGDAWALQSLDLDRSDEDMDEQVFVGARGLALLDERARTTGAAPRWSVDWPAGASPIEDAENHVVGGLALAHVDDDALQDAVFTVAPDNAYAVSGATGRVLWRAKLDTQYFSPRLAAFTTEEGVPAFFPVWGKSAYSMKDGSRLFTVEALTTPVSFAIPTANTDALVVTTEPEAWNDCAAVDCTAMHNLYVLERNGAVRSSARTPGLASAVASADLDPYEDVFPTPPRFAESLVGTPDGRLVAVDGDGVRWTVDLAPDETDPLKRPVVTALAAHDVDWDGAAELFAAISQPHGGFPGRIVQVGADGRVRWSVTVGTRTNGLLLQDLDARHDGPELVAAVGELDGSQRGAVLALATAPDVAERVLWRRESTFPVLHVRSATTRVPGQPPGEQPRFENVLLTGDLGTTVRALRPATGEEAWAWAGGGFVMHAATGDVDGDGVDEVVSGDGSGLLILSEAATGRRRWERRVEATYGGEAYHVAMGDLTGDGKAEVVALVRRHGPLAEFAAMEVYAPDGRVLLRRGFTDSLFSEVHVADVDGDGRNELVAAERLTAGCGVRVMDVEGATRWASLASPSCLWPTLHVGNADADAALEVGYAELTSDVFPGAALFDADGTRLWRKEFSYEQSTEGRFVRVVPGGLVFGGGSVQDSHVVRLAAADGAELWRTAFTDFLDVETPGIPLWGTPTHAARVDDRDGDGHPELAVGTFAGEVHLLDGATGRVRWTRAVTPREVPGKVRQGGGPLAFVPATATQPPYLLAALGNEQRRRSEAVVLRLDGEVVTRLPLEGSATAAATGRFTPGAQRGVAVGAGLGVYTYEARKP